VCQPGSLCGSCLFADGAVVARWPLLGRVTVRVGGTDVSCRDALAACGWLEASGASAIASVLAARGSPLAGCDYHSVYRPGLPAARDALAARPGGVGPRGRHLAKHAFCAAVRAQVALAACTALRAALREVATDERYAAAIARDGHDGLQGKARRPLAA
jgi:hypothetical protein